MHRIPVTSVDITQVGYQEDSETLEIQFSRGEVCQYYNVPSGIYDELMKSPIKEEYYYTQIGERFPCTRIR
jgi:KTSC domain